MFIDEQMTLDVRYSSVGSHYLIYVEYGDHFALLDLLHQRVDLSRRLAHIIGKAQI